VEDASGDTTIVGAHLKRFGWFSGVFTPSVLTILGVIMYLRLGWVTGQMGLLGALAVVALSHLITLTTGLSVSAIATNRTVGAGGAYNIISRSLGAPAGAAIGIPLFLAQALSVTFYIVGFTESLSSLWPGLDERLVGSAVLIGLVVISAKSAEMAIKSQYIVMAAIAASLVSLFWGGLDPGPRTGPTEIEWIHHGGVGFAAVFAVFFPAVTGIMAGVGMSGDLRNPRSDLPRGTLFAIALGFVVYMVLPVFLAMNARPEDLINNTDIAWQIARVPELIYVGVWGATLSSAVGSILTAPRTLQALAVDGLAPAALGRGSGPANEPRIGLAVTFLLAETGILLGNLDMIAPILTMFFLATYGLTNLACGLERWAASPGYRPSFRVPALVSLSGAVACFYVMSIINFPAMMGAMFFCGMIFVLTERRDLDTTYGDARHGIWAATARTALLRLRGATFHPANWRPNLVILGGNPDERPWLLALGSALVQDRGIVSYFHLIKGRVADLAGQRRDLLARMEDRLAERLTNVFYRVDIVEDIYPGIVHVAQTSGVGPFEANSVMLGWTRQSTRRSEYVGMLTDLAHLNKSLFLVHWDLDQGIGERRSIHVWWGGLQGNGGLMLLAAHLLTAHHKWRGAEVTVVTVVETEEQRREAIAQMADVLESARVRAEVRVELRQRRPIGQIMREISAEADLAILGIGLPEDPDSPEALAFVDRIDSMLENLGTTVLVHSARDFEGEPLLFAREE
jgi:amino acid transporter